MGACGICSNKYIECNILGPFRFYCRDDTIEINDNIIRENKNIKWR